MSSNAAGIEKVREVVARRFWLGAVTAAVVLAVVGGGVMGLRNLYRATATVQVDPGHASDEGLPAELEARLQVFGQHILGRDSLLGVIDRFGLYPELRKRVPEQVVLQRMRNDVTVESSEAQEPGGRGRTTLFTVSYRGGDRTKVAAVANALAEAYIDKDSRERSATADAVGSELDQVRRRLDEQERRLGAFRSRYAGVLPDQADSSVAGLDRVNSDLRAASESRIRAMERRSLLLKQLAEAEPGVPGDPDAASARMAKLNQELAELRRAYTDRYPDVERKKAEIAAVREQSRQARETSDAQQQHAVAALDPVREALQDAEREIQQSRSEEMALRRRSEEYRQQVQAAPVAGATLLEISRDYETTKTLYEHVLRRYEDARAAAGSKSVDLPGRGFQMLEPALPPALPVGPARVRFLIVAIALSLAAGIAVAFLAEQLDSTFRSTDDLRGFTRVPVLAAIPEVLTRGERVGRWLRRSAAVAAVLLAALALGHASYRVAHGDSAILGIQGRIS